MRYRMLGNTGFNVSAIGFGAVEIGMDYGIKVPGSSGKPDKKEAATLLKKAIEQGINIFDTAPAYGDSEELLGEIIGGEKCIIATKVNIPGKGVNAKHATEDSLNRSLKALRRDALDIVQIHNATEETIRNSELPGILLRAKEKGLLKFIGASVYEPENAFAVIEAGCFDVLQVAYNILDQRMAKEVFEKAESRGIGVFSRSAYFRGLLTEKAEHLGGEFKFLSDNILKLKKELNLSWESLKEMAVRFCLSDERIASVLTGIGSIAELDFAIDVEKRGALGGKEVGELKEFGIEDRFWLNPANWPEN